MRRSDGSALWLVVVLPGEPLFDAVVLEQGVRLLVFALVAFVVIPVAIPVTGSFVPRGEVAGSEQASPLAAQSARGGASGGGAVQQGGICLARCGERAGRRVTRHDRTGGLQRGCAGLIVAQQHQLQRLIEVTRQRQVEGGQLAGVDLIQLLLVLLETVLLRHLFCDLTLSAHQVVEEGGERWLPPLGVAQQKPLCLDLLVVHMQVIVSL
mmetsp:Transcript_16937/g.50650  ORF Transcript_16937/g.50650 Transcript_16937/m.50650 type:complete len:210 (+) Transcript_16937:696-1325(+)